MPIYHTFHGSTVEGITKLRSDLPTNFGGGGRAGSEQVIFTTEDPRIALNYASIVTEEKGIGKATVYAADIELKNPFIYDAKGISRDLERVIQEAKAEGHDGLVVLNSKEGIYPYDKLNTNVIAFNPDSVTIRAQAEITIEAGRLEQLQSEFAGFGGDVIYYAPSADLIITETPITPTLEELLHPVELVEEQTSAGMVAVIEQTVQETGREALALEEPESLFVWVTAEDERVCEDLFENSCAPRAGEALLMDEWEIFGNPQAENLICTMFAKGGGSNCRCWLDATGESAGASPVSISSAVMEGNADAEADYGD